MTTVSCWPTVELVCSFSVARQTIDCNLPPAVNPTHEPPLVYVVDDDEAFRNSLQWLLESDGYRVVTYATAELFLEDAESASATCLVLDVRLPGISGLELQLELKQRGESLPIIFVTGHADARMALDENGASGFLQKPFHDAQLLDLIAEATRHRYAADALTHGLAD